MCQEQFVEIVWCLELRRQWQTSVITQKLKEVDGWYWLLSFYRVSSYAIVVLRVVILSICHTHAL